MRKMVNPVVFLWMMEGVKKPHFIDVFLPQVFLSILFVIFDYLQKLFLPLYWNFSARVFK